MTIINDQTMPTPVQESPSEQIHAKLLNLRDSLNQVCIDMTDKLSPVMKDYPVPSEDKARGNSGLPPLFEQYSELIDNIELVIEDINVKLNSVDI